MIVKQELDNMKCKKIDMSWITPWQDGIYLMMEDKSAIFLNIDHDAGDMAPVVEVLENKEKVQEHLKERAANMERALEKVKQIPRFVPLEARQAEIGRRESDIRALRAFSDSLG